MSASRWLMLAVAAVVGTWSAASARGQIRFREVTEQAGLVKPLAGLMGHGGAWGDWNGDGRIDLYLGGFCDRPDDQYRPASGPVANKLLRNLGNGRFEPVEMPAVEIHGRASGAVFADLDNDGDLELYVANNAKIPTRPIIGQLEKQPIQSAAKHLGSRLYRNDEGRLVDVSKESGACPDALHTARNVGVLDYNGDGLLDLLVIEDRFTRQPRSVLLKNLGGLKFADATKEAGLPDDLFGLGLAVADVNDDGQPDFFVGHSNRFFLSDGNGRYRQSPELNATLAWQPLDAEDWPCGAAFGDLNGDGRLDLVLSIHGVRARNRVYLNEGVEKGVPRFRDVTRDVGLPEEIPAKCPHVEIQDFENDGRPDLYFTAAWLDDSGQITPLVFRNENTGANGLPRFTAPRKIGNPMVYFPAGPSGDYDGDGRIDLALVNWFAGNRTRLLQNVSDSKGGWLDVKVEGGQGINRQGIGSQVRIYEAGKLGQREGLLGLQEIATGYGYASGQEAVCHFGLGERKSVDVDVKLPNGKIVERRDVAANQRIVIESKQ